MAKIITDVGSGQYEEGEGYQEEAAVLEVSNDTEDVNMLLVKVRTREEQGIESSFSIHADELFRIAEFFRP